MQSNEFEKHIKHEMDQFSIDPKDAVWEKVAQRIKKEETKRRGIFFYWTGIALLLLVGTTLWIIDPLTDQPKALLEKETIAGKKTLNNNTSSTIIANKQNGNEQLNKIDKEQSTNNVPSSTNKTSRALTINNTKSSNRINYVESSESFAVKRSANINSQKIAKSNTDRDANKNLLVIAAPENESKSGEVEIADTKAEASVTEEKSTAAGTNAIEKLIEDKIANNHSLQAKTDSSIAVVDNKKKITKANWEYGITALGGISGIANGFGFVTEDKSLSPSFQSSPVSSAQPSFINHSITSHYSFGLGVFAEKSISSRIDFLTAFQYQYYSSHSKAGSRVSGNRSFYDSVLNHQQTVTTYYQPGSSNTVNNHYHFIQLPVDLHLRLNKNIEKAHTIHAGITPAYIISSSALYANYRQNILYKEQKQFTNFQLFGQLGLQFSVWQQARFGVTVGPQVHFSFTNLSKAETQLNQYLYFTGIKTNITIKK